MIVRVNEIKCFLIVEIYSNFKIFVNYRNVFIILNYDEILLFLL